MTCSTRGFKILQNNVFWEPLHKDLENLPNSTPFLKPLLNVLFVLIYLSPKMFCFSVAGFCLCPLFFSFLLTLGIQAPSEKDPLKTPQSTSSGGVWMPRVRKPPVFCCFPPCISLSSQELHGIPMHHRPCFSYPPKQHQG